MATFLLSDVHLRRDRPERAGRLARFVAARGPADALVVGGDLCDFVFASRQLRGDPMACPGLRALADFSDRGGALTILAGNHDTWLGAFYERALGARFVPEPLERTVAGLRLHLVHGHRLGARAPWKAAMESRAFLHAFRVAPAPLARALEGRLDRSNDRHRADDERRHLERFRRHAARLAGAADLVVFGHVHRVIDEPAVAGRPRLVVLGGWHHRSSALRVDEAGAALIVREDGAAGPH